MIKVIGICVFSFLSLVSFAQNTPTKLGYVDVDYVFDKMPENKTVQAELKSLETQLKNQIDSKAQKFQKDVADYQKSMQDGTIPEAVRANTERELQQQQQNLEKLQQDAQVSLQNKQTQLMDPIFKKISKAIQDVAKENGYSMILNQTVGSFDVVLFPIEKNDADISDLVLKKMGVTVTN